MTELSKFYVKDKKTKEVIEVSYYDSKSVSIDVMTFKDLFFKSIRLWYTYLFKMNKCDRKDIAGMIDHNGELIFEEHNAILKDLNRPPIPYFGVTKIKQKDIIPKYIG